MRRTRRRPFFSYHTRTFRPTLPTIPSIPLITLVHQSNTSSLTVIPASTTCRFTYRTLSIVRQTTTNINIVYHTWLWLSISTTFTPIVLLTLTLYPLTTIELISRAGLITSISVGDRRTIINRPNPNLSFHPDILRRGHCHHYQKQA